MPQAPTLLVGERYRLLDRLGSGAMGTVWLARDEQLNRDVAVKEVLIPPDLDDAERATVRARVLREARTAARLDDPTVVQVHDVVDDGVRPWIVMELVRGQTLSEAVSQHGRLEPAFVAAVGLAVLRALRATHAAGILHRDVKPSNVILAHDGRVVLTDFGVAQVDGDPSLTTSGMLIGSPSYMPPERARGERPGPPADLWSLGATLYAAVEGHPPFERGGALPTIAAAMTEPHPPTQYASEQLREVIDGLLVKDPAQRMPASTAEGLLRQARTSVPPPAAPIAPPAPEPAAASERTGTVTFARATAKPVRDYSVVLGAGPDVAPAPERPRRRRALVMAAVVALLLGGLAGVLALDTPIRDLWAGADGAGTTVRDSGAGQPDAPGAGGSGDAAAGAPAASATAPTGQSPTPGQSQLSPGGATAGASASAPSDTDVSPDPVVPPDEVALPDGSAVPAGYRVHEDETGFSVVVPADWTVERDGSLVDFEDPASGRFLRIDQTTQPKGDPVGDWEAQEQSVSQRLAGYELVGIEGLDYRGWEAADWEFTFGVDNPTHVLNRNVVTGPMAYALYWSTPAGEWESSRDVFDIAAASFEPAA